MKEQFWHASANHSSSVSLAASPDLPPCLVHELSPGARNPVMLSSDTKHQASAKAADASDVAVQPDNSLLVTATGNP